MNNTKYEVKFGLPEEVVFCKKCTISNQKPTTTSETKHDVNQKKTTTFFNEDGICDACIWAEYKKTNIDWDAREKELLELLDKYRSKDGSYDVVVPGSGGKDSAYVAHILKEKYGMHPLTVTWAPHMQTDIGRENFDNFIDAGFDNILIKPNGKVHKILTNLAFKNLGHPFQPFILGQRNVGPLMAKQYGIELIFYGENVAEYGNNWRDNLTPAMDIELFTKVDIKDDDLLISGVTVKELREKHEITYHDLLPYASIEKEDIYKSNIEMHYMSYYENWIPQEIYYYATKHSGYKVNTQRTEGTYAKYSSIDDKCDPFHYYMTLIKFGLGRATYDSAHEIRTGHITREEAISLVQTYDTEFPKRFLKDFLLYINMSEKEFYSVIDSFRSEHIWKKVDNKWQLRNQIK
jgi:N-acetyl sugar amidotransferase